VDPAYKAMPEQWVVATDARAVDARKTALVAKALPILSAELGLERPPAVEWYAPERPFQTELRLKYGVFPKRNVKMDSIGYVDPTDLDTVHLDAEQDTDRLLEVLAHELAHLAQFRSFLAGGRTTLDSDADEREASAVGENLARAWEDAELMLRAPSLLQKASRDGFPDSLSWRVAAASVGALPI
jgi:hypothetical protein